MLSTGNANVCFLKIHFHSIPMPAEIAKPRRPDPVTQLTVFADNKVGKLNDLLQFFDSHDLHVLAITQQDSTDFASIRLILNYPDLAKKWLVEEGYSFFETSVIAVEIKSESDLKFVTSALVEAEINIHYLYPFIMRPNGRYALAIKLEDDDLAKSILNAHGLKTLDQSDIAR
jgi:hypothetical protein